MSDQPKQSRLNIKSYFANSIFFLPALSFGIALGNRQTDEEFTGGMIVVAQIISLILVGFYIRFTYRRLHDAGRSGWFSLALIPPFTLFLLIYLFTAKDKEANKWGEPTRSLSMFGIRAKKWRIIGIVLISIFMLYLSGLFATFLFNSSIY